MLENWTALNSEEYLNSDTAEQMITDLVAAAETGYINGLQAYVKLKKILSLADEAVKQVQESAVSEAQKYPEREFEFMGVKIQKKSGAGRWDYKNVEAYNIAKEALKGIEITAQEAFKMIQKGITPVDSDGVVVEAAIYTPGKDTIAIYDNH